ncbi:hypothetical protein [Absidia glauca]|uniref:Uncharacterized protein n=1 Tax=Absidia glauca TaxID=4829 RepID=A0A163K0D6_ABSGL|nr:hypothetical protein [Absidia glauca]
MLPNGIAGVEFHHEHRVLYKSLPEHNDHQYKCIFSDGRLNRFARTEFFRRQSVMSFADRWEQLLAEAGRLVKGGACKIKESTICWEACHRSHQFSWKIGEICAVYRCVVPSALASYLIHVAHTLPAIRADEPQLICVFLLDLIPGEERVLLIPMRRARPFLCLAGRFYLHFELSPPPYRVLIAHKIRHTQIGSIPVVLSVAFPPKKRALTIPAGQQNTEFEMPFRCAASSMHPGIIPFEIVCHGPQSDRRYLSTRFPWPPIGPASS